MEVIIKVTKEPQNWFERLFKIRRPIKGLKKEDFQISGGEITNCAYVDGKYMFTTNRELTPDMQVAEENMDKNLAAHTGNFINYKYK